MMNEADKSTLRRRLLAVRAALPKAERRAASAAACARLATLPEILGARRVAAYAAYATELDIDPFLRALLQQGVEVYLPWVDHDDLGLAQVRDLDRDLAPGWRGVREPQAGRRHAEDPHGIDVAIVPGIAFDRRGNRLGHGGGHFDRLLAGLRDGVPRIGVGFEAQVVHAVPVEAHDRRLDAVVTESGVHRPA
jgi:5-formyltetrahydrofolate cyclo-ligase